MKIIIPFLAVLLVVYAEDIVNTNVLTHVTIKNHLIKVTHKIHFLNNGTRPVKSYIYIAEPHNSLVGVTDESGNKLRNQRIVTNDQYPAKYSIDINDIVKPSEVYVIICTVFLVDLMKPVKKSITLKEEQFVKVETNLHFYSVYFTLSQRCYVLFDNQIEDIYTENPRKEIIDNGMVFEFTNLSPFSFESNKFILKYKKPIYVVQYLERQIYLSMYGKIHVTDNVVVENRASQRLGPYSSIIASSPAEASSSSFFTFLPSAAEDVKYFDELGNNSYSTLIHSEDDVTFKHNSRYPVFGSWKYAYTVQYYVPVYEYLYTDQSGVFYLQMRAIDHVLGSTFIENAITRIVLPEFAKVIKVNILSRFARQEDEVTWSTLGVSGHPTVVFNGSYLIDDELYPFMVKFTYNKYFTFSHAIVIILIIQSVFLLYLIWVRLL